MMKDVFISYSTKDQIAKDELTQLFDNENISYFLDVNDLPLGKDIEEQLMQELKETRFTVMLVSKESLKSIWVGMEAIHRLRQEAFDQKTTFLPILIDKDVLNIDFAVEMAETFHKRKLQLEELRGKLKSFGQPTEIYDVEINRIDKINVSDILIKIRHSLSADFTDEKRKPKDIEKLIQTIKNKIAENPDNPKQITPNNISPEQFQQELLAILQEKAHLGIVAILGKINKTLSYEQYDRTQWVSINSKTSPITLEILSASLVESTKALINSIH